MAAEWQLEMWDVLGGILGDPSRPAKSSAPAYRADAPAPRPSRPVAEPTAAAKPVRAGM